MCFCLFITQRAVRMKIAVIGQSLFGQEVYKELRKDSHTIVGVFTIPDKDGKADPLGEHSTLTGSNLPLPKRHGAVQIELNLSLKSKKKSHMFLYSCQMEFGLLTPPVFITLVPLTPVKVTQSLLFVSKYLCHYL